MRSNYVYIFYNNNDVLYVGKTHNLHRRIIQHKDKWWFAMANRIKYAEFSNKTDMDIYEIYYINKLKPVYNKEDNNKTDFSHDLPQIVFKELSITEFIIMGMHTKRSLERPLIYLNNFSLMSEEVLREHKKSDFEVNGETITVKFSGKSMDLYTYLDAIHNGNLNNITFEELANEKLNIIINNKKYKYVTNVFQDNFKINVEFNEKILKILDNL